MSSKDTMWTTSIVLMVLLGVTLVLDACAHADKIPTKKEGTLVAIRYYITKRNYTPVAVIDGKWVAVKTWAVKYVDDQGITGRCMYYQKIGEYKPKVNEHIKCSTQELQHI